MDHMFSPEILGSQQCEAFFRQIRSLSPTFSTVTNSSIREFLHKISKIELLNDISHIKLEEYTFPRIGKPSHSYYSKIDRQGNRVTGILTTKLPTITEMFEAVHLAKLEAVEYAESLGVVVTGDLSCEMELKPMKENRTLHVRLDRPPAEQNNDMLRLYRDINLSGYSMKVLPEDVREDSLYIKVINAKEEVFVVKKHTLIWLLSKTTTKLSSDRLLRVMGK